MWLAFGSQTRELRDGEIVVGGGAEADWRVPTADLMPRHFAITVDGLNASLKAVSKDNVVAVNGTQLGSAPQLLNQGDVISAGSGRFVFSDNAPVVGPDEETVVEAGFIIDEKAKVSHSLIHRSTTIGRDASNLIVVRDPSASRFHAEVRREAGGFALHSMGSGGTRVNGNKVAAPCLLADGDTIGIAYSRLRFTKSAPADVAPAPLRTGTSDVAQRNPTLSTGRISLVPASGKFGGLPVVIGVVLVLLAIVAFVLTRR